MDTYLLFLFIWNCSKLRILFYRVDRLPPLHVINRRIEHVGDHVDLLELLQRIKGFHQE